MNYYSILVTTPERMEKQIFISRAKAFSFAEFELIKQKGTTEGCYIAEKLLSDMRRHSIKRVGFSNSLKTFSLTIDKIKQVHK